MGINPIYEVWHDSIIEPPNILFLHMCHGDLYVGCLPQSLEQMGNDDPLTHNLHVGDFFTLNNC
jgi:hypothetical protein